MPYEIPETVTLKIKVGESQLSFARRIFMEAARLAGMPLLEQGYFATDMIENGNQIFIKSEKDNTPRLHWFEDPSPKDNDQLVTNLEWKKKQGKWHTHVLGNYPKQELTRRQFYYQLYGGVLGSLKEISPDTDIIIIEVNIVYDETQYTLEQAQKATQATVDDLKIHIAQFMLNLLLLIQKAKAMLLM